MYQIPRTIHEVPINSLIEVKGVSKFHLLEGPGMCIIGVIYVPSCILLCICPACLRRVHVCLHAGRALESCFHASLEMLQAGMKT